MPTKISLNINDETRDAIMELKDKKQINATEVIRNAVSVYKYLHNAQRDGMEIQTVARDGTRVKVVIL